MTDTKIVKLYNVMDARERKGLQLWLNNRSLWSQKKGNHDAILHLHHCLTKYSNRPKKLNEQTKNLKKLGDLRHQLFNIAENYLLVNWLTRKAHKSHNFDLQKKLLIIAYYQDKELSDKNSNISNLSKLIEFKLTDIGKHLEKTDANNIDEYYQIHKFYHHLYYNLSTNIWQKGGEYLKKLLLHLNTFLGLTKMRYYTEALYRTKMMKEEFDLPDIERTQHEMLNLNKSLIKQKANNTLFELYLFCFELSIKESKASLQLLTNKIIEKAHLLNESELGTILTFAINYTTSISRKEGIDLVETQFKLHKLGLERSVFLTNGLLKPQILINFAYSCCEEQQPQEIDIAWQKYQQRIESNHRESTSNLCNAFKSLAQGNFEQAIAYTQMGSKRDFRFYLFKKTIQIRSYYELEDYCNLEDNRNNVLKYLRINKDSLNNYLYQSFFNFAELVRELAKPVINKSLLTEKVDYFCVNPVSISVIST